MTTLATDLAARCAADGEFRLLSRFWTGTLRFSAGPEVAEVVLVDGAVQPPGATRPVAGSSRDLTIAAPAEVWAKMLSPVPPPFFNDIMPARAFGLVVDGDAEAFWQYYPAVRRAVELLRTIASSVPAA